MERKELMVKALEKNPSPADEVSAEFSVDEDKVSLNASPVHRHHHHARDELSPKEFFELLSKQVRLQSLSKISPTMTSGGGSQGSFSSTNHNMMNEGYHSVAIDQCDITSSLDYGSRDYYYPSKITSTSNLCEENDSGEVYDTRGNWWQGSVYY